MNSADVRFDSIRAAMIPGECVHEEKNEKTAPGILSPERFLCQKAYLKLLSDKFLHRQYINGWCRQDHMLVLPSLSDP